MLVVVAHKGNGSRLQKVNTDVINAKYETYPPPSNQIRKEGRLLNEIR